MLDSTTPLTPDIRPLETPQTPGIRLAVPNSQEVERFRALYNERFSLDLTPDEALFVATKYLHMFQILTHEQ